MLLHCSVLATVQKEVVPLHKSYYFWFICATTKQYFCNTTLGYLFKVGKETIQCED